MQPLRNFRAQFNQDIPNGPFGSNEDGESKIQQISLETPSGTVIINGATVINDYMIVEAQSLVQGGLDFGMF